MKNLETLIDDGGSASDIDSTGCVATSSDGSNCLAMLLRRDDETLCALLKRLGKAIALA